MQNSFDTSFIPQQPLLRVEGVEKRKEPVNFALMLAFVVFFVSLVVAGGVFLYDRKVDERILAKQNELEALESSLDSAKIDEYKQVDTRIAVARALLRDHAVFSVVLDFLEQYTPKDIGFLTMDYLVNEKDEVELKLRGVGPNFQSVYFQLRVWQESMKGQGSIITSARVGEVTTDETTGVVSFDSVIMLTPPQLRYAKYLEGSASSTPLDATANPLTP